jgi:hypothetical protein
MNWIVMAILLLMTGTAFADSNTTQVTYPNLAKHSVSAEGFVPTGWKLEQKVQGDFNGDGISDLVLVLQQAPPVITQNSSNTLDEESFAINARILVAAVGTRSSGFNLVLENHDLIPLHDSPTIDDPFDSIAIVKGNLQVAIHFFANMGSWWTANTKFTFKYKENCFRLIGYDRAETQRNSGETTDTSINYLSSKMKITTGNIEDNKKHTKWKNHTGKSDICIDQVGNGFDFGSE